MFFFCKLATVNIVFVKLSTALLKTFITLFFNNKNVK